MPVDRSQWFDRIKAAEREYTALRRAVDEFSQRVRSDANMLKGDVRPRDFRRAAELLEGTYIVRLFAEFETALREYWPTVKATEPPNNMHDLMQSLASASKVPSDQLQQAHEVREYRNALVHERTEMPQSIAIAESRRRLCHFLSRLH